MGETISAADKSTILEKCSSTLAWLDANQAAEKSEFEDTRKELENLFNPIITKAYSSTNAGGGSGSASNDDDGAGGSGSASGPNIEEVD